MIQQKPVSFHKIIFTITCEGETLYDAQIKAMDVSAMIENYDLIEEHSGLTVEMTVGKTDVTDKPDAYINWTA